MIRLDNTSGFIYKTLNDYYMSIGITIEKYVALVYHKMV